MAAPLPQRPTTTRDREQTLAYLRELIRAQAPSALRTPEQTRRRREPLLTAHPALDALIGGWPHPGLAEVHGRLGSGRLQVLLPSLVDLSTRRRTVAIVDPLAQVNPPGLGGMAPAWLLLVRCCPEQSGWAAEQLARSRALPLVVLVDPPRQSRIGARLARAADQGACTVIVVSERSDARLPATLRLHVRGQDLREVEVQLDHLRGAAQGPRTLRLPRR